MRKATVAFSRLFQQLRSLTASEAKRPGSTWKAKKALVNQNLLSFPKFMR